MPEQAFKPAARASEDGRARHSALQPGQATSPPKQIVPWSVGAAEGSHKSVAAGTAKYPVAAKSPNENGPVEKRPLPPPNKAPAKGSRYGEQAANAGPGQGRMVEGIGPAGRAGGGSGSAGGKSRGSSGADVAGHNAAALAAGRRRSDAETAAGVGATAKVAASNAALQGGMHGATTGPPHGGDYAIFKQPSTTRPTALETAGSEFANHLFGALGIVSGGGAESMVPGGEDVAEAGTSVSTATDSFERGASNNRSQEGRGGMPSGATTIASSTATVSPGLKSSLRIDTANYSHPNTLHKSPTGSPGKQPTGANTGRTRTDMRRRSAGTHPCTCARAELTHLLPTQLAPFPNCL